ncbi:MAG TPA: hypothetical protein VMB53_06295 [Gaiellaceae bacterium]|nr:hypothetical protein [Gaiellaceae bacterium]
MFEWLIYAALVASFVAVVAAAARLAVRVSHTWRGFKRLRRQLVKELDRLTLAADMLAAKAERTGDMERLDESLARLRVSLARVQVLRNAMDEVEALVERVAFFYPR